ncbi:LmeA family phospholipid-binding protein [Nakamurella endophytica]|uniref:DUF2993 domain-containing protein n=1 Tax=Nakamurella endophytica TaxID=1748367 RepID=A0A917TB02_9ACTN|nr:DUF2993 domain-containing protein [Nakamurella endophytica]GGM15647.1 hypothetical protein GCM10011594_39620 [Nakamurella endophytica]
MRTLLVTLLLLALVVVGVDIGGRLLAESKAGEAVAREGHLATAPDVTIHGFSFLAQAIPGNYGKITLTSQDLALGPVDGVAAVVDLYDVRLPLSDALQGDTRRLTAGFADLRAQIPTSALAAALHQPGVTVTAGPDGTIRLGTSATVLGRRVPVSVDLGVQFAAGVLRLRAQSVQAAGVSSSVLNGLASGYSLDIPLDGLPVPVTSASARVEGSQLVVVAQLADLTAGMLQ